MRKSIDNVNHMDNAIGEDLVDLVHALMHDLRSLQYQSLKEARDDITHMDAKALGFFARHPGATLSELVQHSGRDKAQMARLVKGLREKGWLDAEPDAQDRRNVRLTVNAAGRAVSTSLERLAKDLAVRAATGLSASERRQLATLLGRMRSNLRSEA